MTYWHLAVVMWLIVGGISATTVPGTETLMSSVPRERSGMGSAANDLTRELGAVLGVAVLGSVLSSAYSKNIAETASHFTGEISSAIEGSLAAALHALQVAGPQAA